VNELRRGQAALAMTTLVGGFCIFVAVALAFLVFSFLNSSYGYQAAERAFAAASGGTSDALLRLQRNKDLDETYSLAVGDYNVSVTVTKDVPDNGETTIDSQAVVSGYKRKIRTVVNVNAETGEVSLRSSLLSP
jgi:hypothetical protein